MAEAIVGQYVVRRKGQTTCVHHKKRLELYCTDCQDLACVECVASHKRHDICSLKDIVPEARKEVKNFIDNTEKVEVSNIQQAIISANDILKKELAHFDDLEEELTKQLEKLKQDLDVLSVSIRSSYQKLKKKNIEIITDHIKDLERTRAEFNSLLSECKKVLQRGSHVNIYDVRKEIHGLKPLPERLILDTATFSPNNQPRDLLRKSFGTMTLSQGHLELASVGAHQPSSTQVTSKERIKVSPKYDLLTDKRVITEFNPPCYIDAICSTCTNDGQIYTMANNTVTQLNRKGEVQHKFEYKVNLSDVRVSPTTQHIWTCSWKDCSVMECVPSPSPVVRFKTENKPRCLCVTADNCILIGMFKQITKYTTQGQILLTTKPSKSGRPVVRTPQRIIECSVTYNVAVVDWNEEDEDDNRHVVVMDRNLQELFHYRGDIPTKYQQNIKNRQGTFNPVDVKYDSVGNLVISDYYRGCVHLLSGGGDYLTLIYTGDTEVWSFGIDVYNVLWVVTGNKVKLLEYCKIDVWGSCLYP